MMEPEKYDKIRQILSRNSPYRGFSPSAFLSRTIEESLGVNSQTHNLTSQKFRKRSTYKAKTVKRRCRKTKLTRARHTRILSEERREVIKEEEVKLVNEDTSKRFNLKIKKESSPNIMRRAVFDSKARTPAPRKPALKMYTLERKKIMNFDKLEEESVSSTEEQDALEEDRKLQSFHFKNMKVESTNEDAKDITEMTDSSPVVARAPRIPRKHPSSFRLKYEAEKRKKSSFMINNEDRTKTIAVDDL